MSKVDVSRPDWLKMLVLWLLLLLIWLQCVVLSSSNRYEWLLDRLHIARLILLLYFKRVIPFVVVLENGDDGLTSFVCGGGGGCGVGIDDDCLLLWLSATRCVEVLLDLLELLSDKSWISETNVWSEVHLNHADYRITHNLAFSCYPVYIPVGE